MSSLWWLRAAQWRRGKGERRRERGDGSGRDGIGLAGRERCGHGKGVGGREEGRREEGGVLKERKKGEEGLIKG